MPPASPERDATVGSAPSPAGVEGPRLELDVLLRQLVDRAEDVIATQGRLRGLLHANELILGDLALPVVLRRIVEAAAELVHARYAALGVIGPDKGLEQFIQVGVDEETAGRIGHLPEGKGLLGALVDDPRAIRLRNMADDPRSVGFPEHHPPMAGFIGVPIRIRDEVFGNLYLSEREVGEFTVEDEELVSALAVTAASAIQNARLYAEARRRQDWLQAATEVTRQLLTLDGAEPLGLIAHRLTDLSDADVVTVALPTHDGTQLMIEVATGEHAEELTAITYAAAGTISGLAIDSGEPILIGDVADAPEIRVHLSDVVSVGPVMAIPLIGSRGVLGAIVIGRLQGRRRFSEVELDMARTFANHATIALELADLRVDQQRVVLLEDRDRIARDMHDHVIQRLFAAGLTMQSVASELGDTEGARRLTGAIDDVDDTISQIRTTIFALRGAREHPVFGTVRQRLMEVIVEHTAAFGFTPHLRFAGPIDQVVPEALVDDLSAVLRESLTNITRHAQATRVEVVVSATGDEVQVDVIDDGVGIGSSTRRSGLTNLRSRAEKHGGRLTAPEHDGTHLRWAVPIPDDAGRAD
ncbi:GAF domain-containing protein [Nocardioides sp. LHG3406-4]|uniref:GAF domain-containing sensor histidine kinase n=1 Tax=Nocardioides sp. LHG3406-4 TaxID=2804575 RepID=UPI003CF11603